MVLSKMKKTIALLREVGLQPTPQRLAVARFVLATTSHLTADEVLAAARRECPTLSRAPWRACRTRSSSASSPTAKADPAYAEGVRKALKS